MPTMKALLIRQIGSADLLHMEEVERPTPGAGEVLVRVHATAANPLDWKLRAGVYPIEPEFSFPFIPGFDVAGIVEEVGAGVDNFAAGGEVFGSSDSGGYAEFARAQASALAHKPSSIDFVQAAAMPIDGLTAWQAL